MDLGIRGKTALVLGAGGGLGRAIALALAAEGVRVAAASKTRESALQTANEIASRGGKAMPIDFDLANIEEFSRQVGAVVGRFGPIDILVNNTGGPPPSGVAGLDAKVWEKYFREMTLSVIALTDQVLPEMRKRRWGRIITSVSSGVIAPIPDLGLSNVLRTPLVAWSKTLANEIGRDGVTANVVLPGRIHTERIEALDARRAAALGKTVNDIVDESTASIPIGRYGRPEEYADVVAFVASERASYITGSILRIDGGMLKSI
jgi:3-oxoacyl-[acyl-carrier protein] reductase